jgi:hypothetical protein
MTRNWLADRLIQASCGAQLEAAPLKRCGLTLGLEQISFLPAPIKPISTMAAQAALGRAFVAAGGTLLVLGGATMAVSSISMAVTKLVVDRTKVWERLEDVWEDCMVHGSSA